MNRLRSCLPTGRRTSLAATGLATSCLVAVAVLTGCSSGQIAQTSLQEPAINGAAGAVGATVVLRNVRIQADQTGDYIRPPQTVELMLVASNNSQDVADRLVRITSDVGTVTLSRDSRLPAGGILFVGTPSGQNIKALDDVEAAAAAKATVALTQPITNGLTYKFTFDFEKAGSTSILVPISTGRPATPEPTPAPAGHP